MLKFSKQTLYGALPDNYLRNAIDHHIEPNLYSPNLFLNE